MLESYKEKTLRSRELWNRSQSVFCGGVNHNLRTFGLDRCGAYPPFIERGEGSRLWDVDGNEYVDWWMTHYTQILGHNHPAIKAALQEQIERGIHFGAVTENQVVFAEKLQQAIPMLRKMRFCGTGSEATMYATRLTRLFTKKRLVAKAYGGWHGGNDSLGYHLGTPFTDAPFYDGVTFDFNNRSSFDSMLREHGDDLAAIIVEPVLGTGGGIAPEPEFLPYLREETEKLGILLIFDEIITGFRLSYGSAGIDVYGVEPDLITLGKVVAGGMHMGAYGGREDVMALATPGAEGGRWVGGGTFSSHPLSMTAGIATLSELKKLRDEYVKLNRYGDKTRENLNVIFQNTNFDVIATGTGSMIFINWLRRALDPPFTGKTIGQELDHKRLDLFQSLLMEKGVFGYHGLGALSFAHSQEDIEFTLETITSVIESVD